MSGIDTEILTEKNKLTNSRTFERVQSKNTRWEGNLELCSQREPFLTLHTFGKLTRFEAQNEQKRSRLRRLKTGVHRNQVVNEIYLEKRPPVNSSVNELQEPESGVHLRRWKHDMGFLEPSNSQDDDKSMLT